LRSLPHLSCSIKCFKLHIEEHHTNDPSQQPEETSASIEKENEEAEPDPQPQQPTTSSPFSALRTHPSFLPLFMRYPQLRKQLNRVYAASQNPAVSASQFYDDAQGEGSQQQRRVPYNERVHGQWTQDKADQVSLDLLMKLKDEDEGVREFLGLVGGVVGGKEEEKEGG
jgi:hypothetical protein